MIEIWHIWVVWGSLVGILALNWFILEKIGVGPSRKSVAANWFAAMFFIGGLLSAVSSAMLVAHREVVVDFEFQKKSLGQIVSLVNRSRVEGELHGSGSSFLGIGGFNVNGSSSTKAYCAFYVKDTNGVASFHQYPAQKVKFDFSGSLNCDYYEKICIRRDGERFVSRDTADNFLIIGIDQSQMSDYIRVDLRQ
jgi:hypothetical protein